MATSRLVVVPDIRAMGLRLLEWTLEAMRQAAVHRGRLQLKAQHLEAGEQGELAALFHLRREGYAVVARRWQSVRRRGDLDLVAWEDDTLCFVEVKTRGSRVGPSAESAVDDDKRQVLRQLGRLYAKTIDPLPDRTRFDLVTVYPDGCLLYRGAFE